MMQPKETTKSPPNGQPNSKKRKQPASAPNNSSTPDKRSKHNSITSVPTKGPPPRKQRFTNLRDARTICSQTSTRALKNGSLDVDKFVKAREFEIRALEDGLIRSKKALTQRAFQQVPKELRRRTASHDVKRVVKRLRGRAGREMVEDNTPTVNGRTRARKVTRTVRLRLETARKLRSLGAKRKVVKAKDAVKVTPVDQDGEKPVEAAVDATKSSGVVKTRAPKIKKCTLTVPPVAKAKFRKRQRSKSWLPTHLFHAKRAHITPPSAPLWRFAIPLTPTAKSYRPTHRASSERAAVAWDTSYISTIGLEGQERSIKGLLGAMGVCDDTLNGAKGVKWRLGTRSWEAWLYAREEPNRALAPVTLVWCATNQAAQAPSAQQCPEKRKRKVFIRVHPSAFLQVWEEVVRVARVQKPVVLVEDLRFEIGSIEVIGPGSTEALLGALWPSPHVEGSEHTLHVAVETLAKLNGVTNPAVLPANAVLGLNIQDPRLHHPPRTIKPPTPDQHSGLLELLANWPLDDQSAPAAIFDRKARTIASVALPSQKAINRRKALAPPGQYPELSSKDPRIPILLYTKSSSSSPSPDSKSNRRSTSRSRHQASWTALLPWKAVQPAWYSVLYYPLSTGGQVRFGGLREKRQIAFEQGTPWFPGDFAGTKAGNQWEQAETERRKKEWEARPRGKRVSWDAVDVGGGRKGEVGVGWACDWERLLAGPPKIGGEELTGEEPTQDDKPPRPTDDQTGEAHAVTPPAKTPLPPMLYHLPSSRARTLLSPTNKLPAGLNTTLITVRIALLTRGVPLPCARIYRLPSISTQPSLYKQWLALLPANQPKQSKRHGLPKLPKEAPTHEVHRRLAQSLLDPPRPGQDAYPVCPGEEDLVGFVTTGNFNLGEGHGTGIGNLLLARVVDEARTRAADGRVCLVRNSGESVARIAQWDLV